MANAKPDNSIYPAASRDFFDAVAVIRRRRQVFRPVSCLSSLLATFNKVFAIISARYQQLNIDTAHNDRLNFAPMTMTMQQQRQIGDENMPVGPNKSRLNLMAWGLGTDRSSTYNNKACLIRLKSR